MTTDGFGNGLDDKYKVFFEDPETKGRLSVTFNHSEITAHRNNVAQAKYSDLVPIKGVGMVKKSAILGEKKLNAGGGKDVSHIVQHIHGLVIGVPNLSEPGYQVERVTYEGRNPIYTQLDFIAKALWDKKKDHEKEYWIKQAIKNDL